MTFILPGIILNTLASMYDGRLQHKYTYFALNMHCMYMQQRLFHATVAIFMGDLRYLNNALFLSF